MKIINQLISMLFSSILVKILGFITVIFLSNKLGAEKKGIVDSIFILCNFLPVFLFMGVGISFKYYSGQNPNKHKVYIRAVWGWSLLLTFSTILIFLILKKQIWGIVFKTYDFSWIYYMYIILSVLIVFITYILNDIIISKQKINIFNISNVAPVLIKLCLVISLILVFGFTVNNVILISLIALASKMIIMLFSCRDDIFYPKFNYKIMKMFLEFGFKETWGNVLTKINVSFDKIYLLLLFTKADLGTYTISVLWASILEIIPQGITPYLVTLVSKGVKNPNNIKMVKLISRIILFVNLFAVVIIAVSGFYLIPIVFGRQFQGAVMPMILLLPGVFARSWTKILVKYSTGSGKPMFNSYSALSSVVVYIPSLMIFSKYYGLNGVAIASTIAYVIYTIVIIVFLERIEFSLYDFCLIKRNDIMIIGEYIKKKMRLK